VKALNDKELAGLKQFTIKREWEGVKLGEEIEKEIKDSNNLFNDMWFAKKIGDFIDLRISNQVNKAFLKLSRKEFIQKSEDLTKKWKSLHKKKYETLKSDILQGIDLENAGKELYSDSKSVKENDFFYNYFWLRQIRGRENNIKADYIILKEHAMLNLKEETRSIEKLIKKINKLKASKNPPIKPQDDDCEALALETVSLFNSHSYSKYIYNCRKKENFSSDEIVDNFYMDNLKQISELTKDEDCSFMEILEKNFSLFDSLEENSSLKVILDKNKEREKEFHEEVIKNWNVADTISKGKDIMDEQFYSDFAPLEGFSTFYENWLYEKVCTLELYSISIFLQDYV
jgi:hypothetical protein